MTKEWETSMKKALALVVLCTLVLTTIGCHTTGHFRVPEGSALYVGNRPEPLTIRSNGSADARPFVYRYSSGIPYRLEKDGTIVREGTLRSQFRVVSIFWPPFAFTYWPLGFRSDTIYDLTQAPASGSRK